MKVTILKAFIIVLLYNGLSIGCVRASSAIMGTYEKVDQPIVQQIDLTADNIQASAFKSDSKIDCHSLQSDFCVAIGIDRNRNDHRTHDAGLRLFLVEKTNNGFKVRDRSHGSNSAYNLTPTFYYNAKTASWIILAENGAEYSYGTRVFIFKDKMLADVGTLNVAFQGKFGEVKTNGVTTAITNEVSIVPYTVISTVNNSLVFSFTQDVEHNPGSNDQRTIAKGRIRYIYSKDKLQEVIDPEKTTVFPDGLRPTQGDRILESKTLQGQFKQLLQGDYLYATVTTKTGDVTFLIEGHESCFLQQTQAQDLIIQYDQIERYTPELSGYRTVNVIRDIRTPQINLQTWYSKVTTADLARCAMTRANS